MTLVTTLPGRDSRTAPRRRAAFGSVLSTLQQWRRRARERAELARFSPRELHDIGVSPGEARWEINKPFWKA